MSIDTRGGGRAADSPIAESPSPSVDMSTSWAEPTGDEIGSGPPENTGPRADDAPAPEGVDRSAVFAERADLHLFQEDNARNIDGTFADTCALAASTQVAQDMGADVAFDSVINHAVEEGLCSEGGGMQPDNIRRLLEDQGVPANVHSGVDLVGISGDVRAGRGVVAGVDSSYLRDEVSSQIGGIDHAVSLVWVDVDEKYNPTTVYFNDSAFPGDQGRAVAMPADQFRKAMTDQGTAIITDHTRPQDVRS